MIRWIALGALAFVAGLAAALAPPSAPRPPLASSPPLARGRADGDGNEARPLFVDVTQAAGLRWGIRSVALRGWNVVETMGGGGGFVDYDGDGRLDIYLVSYSTRAQEGHGGPLGDALYRNNGDGTFADVTKEAGIRGVRRGQGLAVGDYDNDGHSDLYVTAHGTSVLYHNEGNGTFRDVTSVAGVLNKRWGCSTTFLDYDRDGWLDLFVSNYLELDPDNLKSLPCYLVDEYPFCQIAQFRGQASVLYRNNRDGTFTDVSLESGVAEAKGKGMGVVAADLDDDGWIDIFQTNDSTPNFLFKNQGNGRFRDVALEAYVGLGPSGNASGAMSADAEDLDGDGRLDLLVTNFNHQGTFLHSNAGDMTFNERGTRLGLTQPTFITSTFGARFLDHDNDGLIDLFVAVGHPFAPVSKVWPDVRFDGPPFLFENDGRGFVNVAAQSGEALRRPYAGRGVATGDYDDDGDPDVLLLCVGQPPKLLRNDGGNRGHWLGVRLVGTRSGRDAIGAKVTVTAGGRARMRCRVGGASYLSSSDPRILFGLGTVDRVDALEVRWPSGQVDRLAGPPVDGYVTLTESTPASN
jgi:enediyne biosynthesis protein E4